MDIYQKPLFIIDVESVGLYGEGFAVAGAVWHDGRVVDIFQRACPVEAAEGSDEDRQWVLGNVPLNNLTYTNKNPREVRQAFMEKWRGLRQEYPGIWMAGDCIFPVETRFVEQTTREHTPPGSFPSDSPYPLIDIASILAAAGMDPTESYSRGADQELHHPMGDVLHSVHRLSLASIKLTGIARKYP